MTASDTHAVHVHDAHTVVLLAEEPVVAGYPCHSCHSWRPAQRSDEYGWCRGAWASAAGGGIQTHRWSGCEQWSAVEDWS